MKNIFITGEIGVGKSTLLKNIIEGLSMSIGGFTTDKHIIEEKNSLKRTFIAKSLLNEEDKYTIGSVYTINNKHNIKVNYGEFENLAINVIDKSTLICDAIVLDEIGFMENNIDVFKISVINALNSDKLVIGVLKKRNTPFLESIKCRRDVLLFEVTESNRSELLVEIINIIHNDFGNLIAR